MRTLILRATVLAAAAAAVMIPTAAAAAGGPPVLSWAPTTAAGSYNYGTLTAGQVVAHTFTLTNSGGSASSALVVTLTGSSAFTKTTDTCSGTSLGPRKTCTVTIAYTAPAVPGQAGTATLTATGNKPAATATLALAGAAAKVTPALATTSSGGPVGTTVTDTATLSGGYQPTGTIEFQLYSMAGCSGTPVDDETVTVTGDGTYTTPSGATLAQAGTYYWTVRYSGDTANTSAATSCGTDTVTISQASPAITDVGGGGCNGFPCSPVVDTATLSGGDNPTGTIEFQLYPMGNCSGTPVADETVVVTGNGIYRTPNGYQPTEAPSSFYTWTASYSGDANNAPATTGCAQTGGVAYNPPR